MSGEASHDEGPGRAPGFFESVRNNMEAAKKKAEEENERRAAAERQEKAVTAGPPKVLTNKPAKKS